MASAVTLDRNCAGMFVRCTSSTRSCSERRLSSRVVATLLAIVPLLLLEPTRRPLLSGLQAQRFRVRLEDNMTIIKGSDGSCNCGTKGEADFGIAPHFLGFLDPKSHVIWASRSGCDFIQSFYNREGAPTNGQTRGSSGSRAHGGSRQVTYDEILARASASHSFGL